MTATNPPAVSDYQKCADLQMASEAFLREEGVGNKLHASGEDLRKALVIGNLHASRFTETQAVPFVAAWTVVDQKINTPTGFSGTLFRNNQTNELVMSFRSTEFIDDSAHDNKATNAMEISAYGFAFGQIRDMEAWYQELRANGSIPAGAAFSVTGYSLGGHLATAFNMLHGQETVADGGLRVRQVVTFNGAGIGGLDGEHTGPAQLGEQFTQLMAQFTTLSRNTDGQAFTFDDAALAALSQRARSAINGGGNLSIGDQELLDSIAVPAPDGSGLTYTAQARQQA